MAPLTIVLPDEPKTPNTNEVCPEPSKPPKEKKIRTKTEKTTKKRKAPKVDEPKAQETKKRKSTSQVPAKKKSTPKAKTMSDDDDGEDFSSPIIKTEKKSTKKKLCVVDHKDVVRVVDNLLVFSQRASFKKSQRVVLNAVGSVPFSRLVFSPNFETHQYLDDKDGVVVITLTVLANFISEIGDVIALV